MNKTPKRKHPQTTSIKCKLTSTQKKEVTELAVGYGLTCTALVRMLIARAIAEHKRDGG